MLDIVARHPSTARYIATQALPAVRRAIRRPQELVDRAAETFTRTDGDIRQVVWTIVTSPEFYSRAAYRSKVKSPFEVVVSSLRAVDAAPDTIAPHRADHRPDGRADLRTPGAERVSGDRARAG